MYYMGMLSLSWAVLLFALTLMVISRLYWRWTHRHMLRLAAQVPGPPSLPIIGNALILMASPVELLSVLSSFMDTYGEYVRFWVGTDLNICVKNPDDIKLLLMSNSVTQKGPSYEFMKTFVGPGLLTGGNQWRSHRKMVQHSYNRKAVTSFTGVFNKEAEHLAEVLLSKDSTITFNVYEDVVAMTTQSVCQTVMGLSKEDSCNVNRLDEFVRETQKMYTLSFLKMTRWWYQIPVVYWLIGEKKTQDYFLNIIDELTSDIVEKRRKFLTGESKPDTKQDESKHYDQVPGIVDRFILSGELTEQEIKWETVTLFTASQEACAKIASGVLLFLAHLPDWQDKVHNEIKEVLGPNDKFVSEDDLKDLHCLDMVYKEVLRYLSIGAMLQRTVTEDIAINNGKIVLPKGTSLVIPIHELHRDPRYWEQPHKVMPERFLPENCKDRNPNAFVPFSLGPMDCIGRLFGTMLVKIIVVHVLRSVILEADGNIEDLDIHVAISVKFAKGYNLRARPRI